MKNKYKKKVVTSDAGLSAKSDKDMIYQAMDTYAISVIHRPTFPVMVISEETAEKIKEMVPDRAGDIYTAKEYMDKYRSNSQQHVDDIIETYSEEDDISITKTASICNLPSKKSIQDSGADDWMVNMSNNIQFIVMGKSDYVSIEPL